MKVGDYVAGVIGPIRIRPGNTRNKRAASVTGVGDLTESGKRWEQLQREYSNAASEKYYEEYPEHRPAKEKD